MQRDIAVVLDADLECLLDQLIALGGVGLDQHLVGERVQLLVAVTPEIGFAARGILGIVTAAHDVVQHVLGIERGRGPAQQIERGLVAAGLQHLGEILLLRLRQQVDLDADAGQHADHGLADRGVIDITVVGAVHRQFEAVGIAGLRQQLLGAVGIEFRPREILRQRKQLRRDHQRRRGRQPAHDAVLDQLDVDRLVEGFADADVLEGVLALDVRIQEFVAGLVHAEEDGAQFRSGHDLGGAAGVDARDILDRNRLDDVDLARQQRRDPRRIRADRREDDLLQRCSGLRHQPAKGLNTVFTPG